MIRLILFFLNCRWMHLRNNILSTDSIFNRIDSLSNSINDAVYRDLEKWHTDKTMTDYEDKIWDLKNWINNRLEWLDLNIPGDCEINLTDYYSEKSLIKTVDILGRESLGKGFYLNIYDDGSVEKNI